MLWEDGSCDWYPLQRVVVDESVIGAAALGWPQAGEQLTKSGSDDWQHGHSDSLPAEDGAVLPSPDGGPPPQEAAPPQSGAPPLRGEWGPRALPPAGTDQHLDDFDSGLEAAGAPEQGSVVDQPLQPDTEHSEDSLRRSTRERKAPDRYIPGAYSLSS